MARLSEIVDYHILASRDARDRGTLGVAAHEVNGALEAARESGERVLLRRAHEMHGNVLIRARAYGDAKRAFERASTFANVDSLVFWKLEAAICECDFFLGHHASCTRRLDKLAKQVTPGKLNSDEQQAIDSKIEWVRSNLKLAYGSYAEAATGFLRLAEGSKGLAKSDHLHAAGLARVLEADSLGVAEWEQRWQEGTALVGEARAFLPKADGGTLDENQVELDLTCLFAKLVAVRKKGAVGDSGVLRPISDGLDAVWPRDARLRMPPRLVFELAWLQRHVALALHDDHMLSAADNMLTAISGDDSYPYWVVTDWVPRFSWTDGISPVTTPSEELRERAVPPPPAERQRARALVGSLLGVLVLGFAWPALAGNWALQGRVFLPDGAPAPFATVTIATAGVKAATLTDRAGRYSLALADPSVDVALSVATLGACQSDVNTNGQGTDLTQQDFHLRCPPAQAP